ncbi:hypothetical protein LOD99_2720 [Oopsacas minuta]|uniref:Transmembrane protein n=1 Tax=Oopsacas minuta TaxID=111878 RepID=A0AAV7K1R8_9METZ|nr:hypothetical protein LOD99_2720 [Oopsacas minuta]
MSTSMRPNFPSHFKHMPCGTMWVKMAGVGGITALVVKYYALKSESLTEESKNDISLAVQHQLAASVLLIALPNGRPYGVPKGLLCIGTLLFCGGTYLRSFYELSLGHLPFIGQLLYGLAWCSMIFAY